METATNTGGVVLEPGAAVDTTYVVLEKDASGYWREVDKVDARGSRAAIREVAEKPLTLKSDETTTAEVGKRWLVAVPARSWKPLPVEIETKTQLKIG